MACCLHTINGRQLMSKATHVQYGCGLSAPEGWLNFDSSPSLRLQRLPILGRALGARLPRFPKSVRYGDIVKGLPVRDATCSGVYASHVLEHLALNDLRIALRNTLRVLRPGGVFRLLVPDLEHLAKEYLASGQPDAAIRFVELSMLGRRHRPRGVWGRFREAVGNSNHLWMWDYKSLSAECNRAGFDPVRPCVFGDAPDPAFAAVEDAGRFAHAVAIEARRPEDQD